MAGASLIQLPKIPDFDEWLLSEIGRARAKLVELERTFPSAPREELAQRLIDRKKGIATTGGAISGLFGLAAIPADLALVAYLELALTVELAVLYGVNLKAASGRNELLDVLGFENGTLGPIYRAAPLIAGKLSTAVLRKIGWHALGRAVPIVAAPLTAWMNNRDIQHVGNHAMRRFGSFRRLKAAAVVEDA